MSPREGFQWGPCPVDDPEGYAEVKRKRAEEEVKRAAKEKLAEEGDPKKFKWGRTFESKEKPTPSKKNQRRNK